MTFVKCQIRRVSEEGVSVSQDSSPKTDNVVSIKVLITSIHLVVDENNVLKTPVMSLSVTYVRYTVYNIHLYICLISRLKREFRTKTSLYFTLVSV